MAFAIAAILILIAFAVGVFTRGRKIGLALVTMALAVMVAWHDNVHTLEWVIFAVLFIAAVIYTLAGHFRVGARAVAGIIILMIAALMATPINLPALTLGDFGDNVMAMEQSIKGQLDDTNKRVAELEKRVDTLEKRMDTNEKSDTDLKAEVEKLKAQVDTLTANQQKLATSQQKLEADFDVFKKEVKGIVSTATPIDLTSEQVAKALAADLVAQGFSPDQIRVGTVDVDENAFDPGANAFAPRSLNSVEKLKAQINGASPQAQATRQHLLAAVPKSERARLLSGRGFVPLQFKVKTCLQGNTYYLGGKAVRGSVTCHEAGDVIWVYVGSDGKVYWDASVRGDCSNPGMTAPPRPALPHRGSPRPSSTPTPASTHPTSPPATSTTQPGGGGGSSTTSTTPSSTTTTSSSTTSSPPVTSSTTTTCGPGGSDGHGGYCSPKTSAPPPPGQSPRPNTGPVTTPAQPSPTSKAIPLRPSSSTTRSPSPSGTTPGSGDGHTSTGSPTTAVSSASPTISGTANPG